MLESTIKTNGTPGGKTRLWGGAKVIVCMEKIQKIRIVLAERGSIFAVSLDRALLAKRLKKSVHCYRERFFLERRRGAERSRNLVLASSLGWDNPYN